MSVPPNTFPHGYQIAYNVVTGGHSDEPAPDQSGTLRIIDPIRHGQQVNQNDLPFVTTLRTPTQSALEETPFPPEPGSIVAVSFNMGDPTSRAVVGMPNEINNSQSVAGNNPLMFHILSAIAKDVMKYKPTKYQEKQHRGALVRAIDQESGNWKHELTKGLPTHAALYPLAGQVLPAIKQIDTAVKEFASILGQGSIGQIPGSIMNLSSLFKKLTKEQKKKIFKDKPETLINAMESMMDLMVDGEGSGAYISSGRIHEETFIENMIEMLSQCTNLSDLVECMQRIRYDETLHGLDKIQDIELKANSAFGEIVFTVDKNGKTKQKEDSLKKILDAVQKFVGLMNSAQAGGQGKTMFGKEAQKVMDAVNRLPGEAAKRLAVLQDTEQSRKGVRGPSCGFNLRGQLKQAMDQFKKGEIA
jgi:hypothetical protein